jgi:hypothetical protein
MFYFSAIKSSLMWLIIFTFLFYITEAYCSETDPVILKGSIQKNEIFIDHYDIDHYDKIGEFYSLISDLIEADNDLNIRYNHFIKKGNTDEAVPCLIKKGDIIKLSSNDSENGELKTRNLFLTSKNTYASSALVEPHLHYKERGNHWEGIKPRPVRGPDIELISVKVDHKEKYSHLPPLLRIKFYLSPSLDDTSQVYITVREMDYKHNYLLNKVKPGPWTSGFNNIFQWSTQDVLQHIDKIRVDDLGVLIRLGKSEPTIKEKVTPAILYYTQFPNHIRGYLFTFKVRHLANLEFSLNKEKQTKPLLKQFIRMQRGGEPFTFLWNCQKVSEGNYILEVEGYFVHNNEHFSTSVSFYHQPVVK